MNEYFANKIDVDELEAKIETYHRDLEQMGHSDKILRAYSQYFGVGLEQQSDSIRPGGVAGEQSRLSVNDFRSLLTHQLTLTTSERAAFDVLAVNTDYKSQQQAILGEQILDFYLKDRKLGGMLKNATENSLWAGEGFVSMDWDTEAGDPYGVDPDSSKQVRDGDIVYDTHHTLDVARDINKEGEQDWVILTKYMNKYDLATKYPEHADVIYDSESTVQNRYRRSLQPATVQDDTDLIPVNFFYHRKSTVVPEGKYVVFVCGQILLDSVLPYEKIPLYRIASADYTGTCLGYTHAWDILGLQEAKDELFSSVLTNNINHSKQLISAPIGSDITVQRVSDGCSILYYEAGEKSPESLNLVQSSPETYNLIDRIQTAMQTQTGINDVIRGDPAASLRSGNALALISAQAMKFSSTLHNSYNELLEDVGSATLSFLKTFASTPRFAFLVGKNLRTTMKSFQGDDLQGVSRVSVQQVSPLAKTTAGRIQIAENLLDKGLIKRPEQYITCLETGRLDPLIEAERSELQNIVAENELLRSGGLPESIITDDHNLHLREHKAVISDPETRKNPEVVQAVLQHMQDHYNDLTMTDPQFLLALGVVPPAPPEAMPPGNGEISEPMSEEPSLPELPEEAPVEDQQAFDDMNLE